MLAILPPRHLAQPHVIGTVCVALLGILSTSCTLQLVSPTPTEAAVTISVTPPSDPEIAAMLGDKARICSAVLAPPGAYPAWNNAIALSTEGHLPGPQAMFDLSLYDCSDPPVFIYSKLGVDGRKPMNVIKLDAHDFAAARAEGILRGVIGDRLAHDRFDRAEKLFKTSLQVAPTPRGYAGLATVKAGQGNVEEELEAWAAATALVQKTDSRYEESDSNGFRRAWVWSQYARSLRLNGQVDEAKTAYSYARQSWDRLPASTNLGPTDSMERGIARHFGGDESGSAADFDAVIESREPEANRWLLEFLVVHTTDVSRARKALLDTPLHASNIGIYETLLLAAMSRRLGQNEAARQLLGRAAHCTPKTAGDRLDRVQCAWYVPKQAGGMGSALADSRLPALRRLHDRHLAGLARLYLDPDQPTLRRNLLGSLDGDVEFATEVRFYLGLLDWAQRHDEDARTAMTQVIHLGVSSFLEFWFARELLSVLGKPKGGQQ